MPNVSVVIPNHNKGNLVRQTLESVLAQTYPVEVIVVDDASTDTSRDLVRMFGRENDRVKTILLEDNKGGSHCRNVGLAAASGDYVIFLDSDDLLAPDCCEARLAAATRHPHHDMWVFPMQTFRDDPKLATSTWTPSENRDHLAAFLRHRLPWSVMQPIWHRSFLDRLGGFDESFVRLQDPELHARALLAGARVKCFPDAAPDCFYRIAEDRTAIDPANAARRHATAAIHFYSTFAGKTGPRLPQLSGTLQAAIARTITQWRAGQIDAAQMQAICAELVAACMIPSHRRMLASYVAVSRAIPFHPPGLSGLVRSLLG